MGVGCGGCVSGNAGIFAVALEICRRIGPVYGNVISHRLRRDRVERGVSLRRIFVTGGIVLWVPVSVRIRVKVVAVTTLSGIRRWIHCGTD